MPRVWISLGSNQDREHHLRVAVKLLQQHYTPLNISTVYESPALGFAGDPFYNLIVGFNTSESPQAIIAVLKSIENACGRTRSSNKFVPRSLDLDLLTWGDLVSVQNGLILPRSEILTYAFVLCPLAEVAGQECHPVTGQTYQTLWIAFDKASQPLWPVAVNLM